MIAVIFEVWPHEGCRDDYLQLAANLRPLLAEIDGFISVERFQSITDPGKLLSLSIWRDEAADRKEEFCRYCPVLGWPRSLHYLNSGHNDSLFYSPPSLYFRFISRRPIPCPSYQWSSAYLADLETSPTGETSIFIQKPLRLFRHKNADLFRFEGEGDP